MLTHCHSDHCALLPQIREAFHPKVLAFCPNIDGVTGLLRDGDAVKMGDEVFEVIHTPGHSSDSVCFYNQTEGVLFAALEKLCARDVRRIYFGHGAALSERCNERLRESQMVAAGSPAAT